MGGPELKGYEAWLEKTCTEAHYILGYWEKPGNVWSKKNEYDSLYGIILISECEEDLSVCHKMHVTDEYFQMLEAGTKRAEFRVLDEKRQVIQAGDFIDFFCQNDSIKTLRLKVAEIIHAPTFEALFDLLPPSLFREIPKQKQLLDLENFYKHKTNHSQVVALLFENYDKKNISIDKH